MGPGVAGLKRQATGKAALQAEPQCMVGARSDIGFGVHRTVRVAAGIILVKRTLTNDVAGSISPLRFRDAEVHPSTGKQSHAARPDILRRRQKVAGQFVIDGQSPGLGIKVATPMALKLPRLLLRCGAHAT